MKKLFTLKNAFILSLAVIVALTAAVVVSNKRLYESKKELAGRNISDWGDLYLISENELVKYNFTSKEFYLKHNTVIHDVAFQLYPRYEFNDFLTLDYDPFLQSICNNQIPDKYYDEALKLYLEINSELGELCSFVLNEYQDDIGKSIRLLEQESDESLKVREKMKSFKETGYKKIEEFKNKLKAEGIYI